MYQLVDDNLDVIRQIKQRQNTVVFSSLRQFDHPVESQGFAIKYVAEGTEHYTLNGQWYPVCQHQYLLLNHTCSGRVAIESPAAVLGVCINLSPQLMAEIVASQRRPDTAFIDPELGEFFSSTLFLENHYDAQRTHLGRFLLQLSQPSCPPLDFSLEFFYTIAEQIVIDQTPVYRALQGIPSIKPATKKDLYKRLLRGREFMDCAFGQPLLIEDIAREACMSEYHFFRLFKQVFGLSPNQYLIGRRLAYGYQLLKTSQCSVSAAAIAAGFADIHTFSKAFKRQYGYSPSMLGVYN